MKILLRALAALAVIALAACGNVTNGTSILPNVSSVPLNYGKLTFAVGTATLQDGTTGVNVVAYLRQPNGLTAYLVNSPSIDGPAGFTVPSNAATAGNSDAGTANITSTPQGGAASTTFGTNGGVYGGGIGPFNSTNGSASRYPGNPPPYPTPLFSTGSGATGPAELLIGQPIISTPLYNINYPPGFSGYLPGFTAFEAAPAAGTYTMNVGVATTSSSTTITGSGTLGSATAVLGATAAPTVTEDGTGGFSAINFTAPAGTVESIVFVENTTNHYFYSVETKGAGAQSASLGDNFGACGTAGARSLCTSSTSTGPSFFAGEGYSITVVSFDYNDAEATQPGNTSQTPTLGLSGNGQADISISPATIGTY